MMVLTYSENNSGMVANKHNSQPTSGNIYVTKATTINASVPIIVALGSIFENNFATLY